LLKQFISFLQKQLSLLSRFWKPLTQKAASTNFKQLRMENPVKSVGMKLFIIFFLCIVVLVISTGLFSYSQSKGIIKDKMETATKQTIEQTGDKMDLVFRDYENMTFDILMDTEIKGYLNTYTDINGGEYDKLVAARSILEKFKKKLYSKNGCVK
jgi:methyl-accepting chemotaxis protein